MASEHRTGTAAEDGQGRGGRRATISDEYRQLLGSLHATASDWGSTGGRFAPVLRTLAERLGTTDILDYGCGKAALQDALGISIRCYDPAIAARAAPPAAADLVACIDVLEHVEREHLDAVLEDLERVTRRLGVFTVATRPAVQILPDGRNAHLIQEPLDWWRDQLAARFEILRSHDVAGYEATFIVAPRIRPGGSAS